MSEFNQLLTPFAEKLGDIPLPEYPRPTLVRESFINLNGKWKFGVCDSIENAVFDREILVPYPQESLLSGINEVFDESKTLCYKREFSLPDGFNRGRVILHFGAVDQVAEVFLNGNNIGSHIGGYAPFSFDITEYLSENNTLTVFVRDNLSDLILPYGKQSNKRGGMWYTPVSGIWQTVWIESVRENYIERLDLPTTPDDPTITAHFRGQKEDGTVTVSTPDGKLSFPLKDGKAEITLDSPRLWSPDDPYLYEFEIVTESDTVRSYFALRSLEIKTFDSHQRLCLNGKPYFFHGLLDQGYFSDGIFTPASVECMESDILRAKALGFNMLRKHIKVEHPYFYHLCDKHGIVVFQDMVNNGKYSFFFDTALPTVGFISRSDKKLHRDKRSRRAFLSHLDETVKLLKNHASICLWTIFNEGWGQFDGNSAYKRLKKLDPTRFIDTASGWFRCKETDLDSRHIYFRKVKLKPKDKPMFLSEFGGYSYRVEDHVFNPDKAYGYGKCDSREEFVSALRRLYEEEIIPLVGNGLCAAVYTQLTDIEDEINGLITYDRAVMKVTPEEFSDIGEKLKI
ncbi:MAG: glycoside hydrolase family 2 [Ruminococcaceae bacterium]|nr:glycoside hydrolase family 2 [Oscillospiraceae bacterium]